MPSSATKDIFGHEGYTIEQMHERISYYRCAIRDLHARLNSFALIGRLPVELLIKIFEHYVALHVDSDDNNTWFKITHVCRHWRDAALNSPSLWTHIHVTKYPDCVQMMLHRSGQLPLVVKANVLSAGSALQLVLIHLNRIRVLDLNTDIHGAWLSLLQDLVVPPTSTLECVTLRRNFFESEIPAISLPQSLPNLRQLQCFRHPFRSVKPFIRPSLKHLSINTVQEDFLVTAMDIVDILGVLPLLETLRLGVLDFDEEDLHLDFITLARIIPLKYLRSLHLNMFSSTWLLERLHLPELSQISLYSERVDEDEDRSMWSILVSKIVEASGEPGCRIRSLAVILDIDEETVHLKGWITVETISDIQRNFSPPQVELCLPGFWDVDYHNIVRTILQSSPHLAVQALFLGFAGYLPDIQTEAIPRFAGLLSTMCDLRSVGFWNWQEEHVAMLLTSKCTTAPTQKTFVMPSLNTLVLRRISFFSDRYGDRRKDGIPYALQERRRQLRPLERLIVEKCFDLKRSVGDSLRDSVVQIQWRWDGQSYSKRDHKDNLGKWDSRWNTDDIDYDDEPEVRVANTEW